MRGSTAGLGDDLRAITSKHYKLLTITDQLISSIIVTPLVVSYWRGTWLCMDLFIYRNQPYKSVLISIIIGIFGALFFTIRQDQFHNIITNNNNIDKKNNRINRLKYILVTKLYTLCFAFVCVNQFRGPWQTLDLFTPVNVPTVSLITSAGILIMICTRTLRNISAPPFSLVLDRFEDYFTVPTYFKSSSDKAFLYLMDCVFSVCVIGTLVVCVWRGSWCLIDLLLFPGEPLKSAIASVAIGYSIVLLTFAMQPLMKHLAKTLTGIVRIIVVDIYLLFSFCGTINVWRGIWNLLNYYFLPGLPSTSFIFTHVASFVMLMLIHSSNSILVRGVYLDGEEQGEQCVDFPCYYIRLILQARRQKRLTKQSEKKQITGKSKTEIDTEPMLTQDTKNQITIVPTKQTNNDGTIPLV